MYCCYRFCCTIVTIFVVLLLPLLLHCDYRFCCISNFLLQKMRSVLLHRGISTSVQIFWLSFGCRKERSDARFETKTDIRKGGENYFDTKIDIGKEVQNFVLLTSIQCELTPINTTNCS
jgi:hypothetical protein